MAETKAEFSVRRVNKEGGLWTYNFTPNGMWLSLSVHCPECHKCTCYNQHDTNFVVPWEIILDMHKAITALDALADHSQQMSEPTPGGRTDDTP